jgi:hypothetical protein
VVAFHFDADHCAHSALTRKEDSAHASFSLTLALAGLGFDLIHPLQTDFD